MSSQHNGFTIHFWGVRGSIACPGPETVRYG
ncbi:MAG: MBL fold metallo-hydrolase, partial [Coleofasciculus sp. C2-GNP5-27]